MRIYQIFTRLFGNTVAQPVPNGTRTQNGCATLDDLTPTALAAIRDMGFSHVWLTGLLDHATTTDYASIGLPASTASITKGKAGSPYAIRNFFDIAPDLAREPERRMLAFERCVERIHAAGLKLLMDFVPNHTAREYRPGGSPDPEVGDVREPGFHRDNFYFYLHEDLHMPFAPDYRESPAKATGNDAFTAAPSVNDWYETVKINYGRDPRTGVSRFEPHPKSWAFMTSVLLFWAAKGVDGFRCDMVDMVPTEFWSYAVAQVRSEYPGLLFVGESYIPSNYAPLIGAGFDLLYDKVGLYDALKDTLTGKADAGAIGKALWDARRHEEHLLRFTENHDEPRMPSVQLLGKTAPALTAFFVTALVGRHLMLYAGQEFGERAAEAEGFSGADGKTTIFDYWSVGCLRRFANGGAWNDQALLPREKALYGQYREVLRLHQLLEDERIVKSYNLQAANADGYGEAGFGDGVAFLAVPGREGRPVLTVANFTSKLTRFTIRIPRDAFAFEGEPVIGEELVHISDARPEAEAVSAGSEGIRVSVTLGGYGCLALRVSFKV